MVFANEDTETPDYKCYSISIHNTIYHTTREEEFDFLYFLGLTSLNERNEVDTRVLGFTWIMRKLEFQTGLGFYWYSRVYDNHQK